MCSDLFGGLLANCLNLGETSAQVVDFDIRERRHRGFA
jgi:hypothetical protein